ncbi:MAG: PH domain-containing protein [Candidatus Micrarchaeota archaeon]
MAVHINTDEIKHLDWKIKILWALNAIIFALFMWLSASAIALYAFPSDLFGIPNALYTFMFLMLIGAIFMPYLVWTELRYRNYTYYLSETEITIRRGVLRIERISIPFEKIQNVNVSRSILERILGLATIKIETAGSNPLEAEGFLPGINNYRELVDKITERVERVRAPKIPAIKSFNEEKLMEEIVSLRAELHELKESYEKKENYSRHPHLKTKSIKSPKEK